LETQYAADFIKFLERRKVFTQQERKGGGFGERGRKVAKGEAG
jgi:hypothetical protein